MADSPLWSQLKRPLRTPARIPVKPCQHPTHFKSLQGVGTLGEVGKSYALNHPSVISTLPWMAGREGVTWQRSVGKKTGRLPGPQALLPPRPCFWPLPRPGKITRKALATTGFTGAGQNHANAS